MTGTAMTGTAGMRIGVFLVAAGFPGRAPGQVLADTVEAIVAAEAAGFDDAWIAEHHFMSYGVCPSAATLAGVALGRTSRIEVGTAVSVLSTHHPVALAEQAAVLHHASGGRFRLGVGRGGPWVDLEVFGTGAERYERGFPESLDLLLAALRRPSVGAGGDFFRFREVAMVPGIGGAYAPVVACTSEATLALAAERGLPMLLGMHAPDAEKAAMIAAYERRGPAGLPHVAAAVGHVADTTQAAVRELTAAMPTWLGPGLASHRPLDDRPRPMRDPHAYTRELCAMHPVGSPEHCVARIAETAERTGLRHLILMVEGAGEQARTLENIARLGAEVLPAVRELSSRRAPASG
ncbi:alkanesulfonate monooxygenase SsuD/methylene tetrahydromethanopterin reductase-like flavin-dependent oxidoreductase (luciferase family) [Thermocatellispora tengchongensis]|uniref:Alkanesulfonate monooxygenase SsuD/methylene tetrahydromethanopterin reductase-like flavin-dependent oxidoreductase (Luciferase family) n=2 Tax=Thermocatellispora tengchongensis TaxID=1073253 RepID=A0A840NW31_9ACTN|nr:alkanesulfonate monooxygenase SsuD/methylene tetrahydromethanopterin reductase-like flavin-dependent oxidoreductase (luciferase family) [Thermocatellispora tengchongensis]